MLLPVDQAGPSSSGSRTDVPVISVICNPYTERAADPDNQFMHKRLIQLTLQILDEM